MFDIYSLTKPRVFMRTDAGGSDTPTPSKTPAVDSYSVQSEILNKKVETISEDNPAAKIYPESVGRIAAAAEITGKASKNIIDALSDLGGTDMVVSNVPVTLESGDTKKYRTEFRPKQGLHNLDFTTPSETPSDNPSGDDNTEQIN